MRRFALTLVVLLSAGAALADPVQTTEVLVLNATATALPQLKNRRGLEIQNLGPNTIYCGLGASTSAVLTKSRKIAASGGTWSLAAGPEIKIWCKATTADQVTGAATVVTELR